MREQLTILVDEHHRGMIENIDENLWLKGLNDLRIALSVRLNVDENSFDKYELMPEEDPQKSVFAVYFWLGWLQENLLSAITA
jgi:hypothetical protein